MPYKFHEPHRHHIEKMRFKVANWSTYDDGLRNRGSLTFWIEEAVLQSWYAAPRTTPGGQPVYADGTIEMILTLGMVYHQPLRQTEGLARSHMSVMDLSLPVPRHSTLSRRCKTLDIQPIKSSARGPIDIVLDGSGLKVFGAGEWCVEKHGKSQRRWRKLSIGLDPKSGEIVAHKLTDSDVGDPDLVAPLLEASGVRIRHFSLMAPMTVIRSMRPCADIRPTLRRQSSFRPVGRQSLRAMLTVQPNATDISR